MSAEGYNGWANRETWALALHINNDQGWQEQTYELLKETQERYAGSDEELHPRYAGEALKEHAETMLTPDGYDDEFAESWPTALQRIACEVGSLWRIDWDELGAAFLTDLDES